MSTDSGLLTEMQDSCRTRFLDEGIGTNPDELIAAWLGGCLSMALANELGLSGFHPERVETAAIATMENLAAGWTMTRIHLDVHAYVAGLSQEDFMKAALAAKANCPIGRLLNANISMTSSLN